MELELKTATGIEVSRSGAPVSRDAILARGLMVVGRRLLEERATGNVRDLSETERRALTLAEESAPAPAEPVTAPEPEKEEPAQPTPTEPAEENEEARLRATFTS